MEVLSAIHGAQERLRREFTRKEFTAGQIRALMIPSDFNDKVSVS